MSYYKTMYDIQKRAAIGFTFVQTGAPFVEEILKNNWSGKHYSNRIWENSDILAEQLDKTLIKGFMSGSSIQRMSKELSENMKVRKYAATRLIRTEASYVANSASLQSYRESGTEKIQFLATLDIRTSKLCKERDREVIEIGKAVIGENAPPLHPNCRSTIIEVFEDDIPEERIRRYRDPTTGKTDLIKGDITYKDWYEKYVANNQKAISEEKKMKNKSGDKKQFEKYKEVLGKDAPKTLAEFQGLKYNDTKECG